VSAATKTVLLINELGAGYGHVSPLLRVGTALAARGCRIVCAMADVVRPSLLLRRAGFPVVQAPVWPGRRLESAAGYSDLLALHGFESVSALMLMAGAWQDMFDLVGPDLIVADHSPTAVLAAYKSIPTALIGAGFTMPPDDLPEFPLLLPDARPLTPEANLLGVVGEVQARRGRPTPPTLPALFAAEFRAVLTLPELDPYLDQRTETVLGPIEPLPVYVPAPSTRSVYAYISTDHPDFREIAASLGTANADVQCYVRGQTGLIGASLEFRGVTVLEDPADLTNVLPNSAVVVGHASSGFAHAGLAAGRPQLALPHDLEKEVTAASLDRLGVSRTLATRLTASDVTEAIEALLSQDGYGHHAAVCAQSILARARVDALETIIEECEKLLA
jgi:UDP:flavonoid glycosyltransferase YjiC (YdhE family)